jgi:AbrB family looped-hinge helix DNA binding protein
MDATVTSKGQITIPKAIRDHLKVKAGDRVKMFIHPDGRVVILPTVPVTALRGIAKSKRHATIEQMNEAIAAAATERAMRR